MNLHIYNGTTERIMQTLERIIPPEPLCKFFISLGKYYIYDGGTSKIIECSEIEYLILLIYIEGDRNFQECFNKFDDNCIETALDEIVKTIKNEDILQVSRFKFVDFTGIEDYINNNLLQITLELTEKCNLRCRYCIYNSSYDLKRNHGTQVMSWNTCKAAIDYLYLHSSKSESVAITFYGGEPLTEYEKIKKCIEYGNRIMGDRELKFSLTTNLTLVTKEMASYFAAVKNLSIVCSLDGPKDINDLYRVDVNGNGSFERAIRGLKYLVEAFGDAAAKRLLFSMVFAPPYTEQHLCRIQTFFDECKWIPENISKLITYPMKNSVEEGIEGDILNEWSMKKVLEGKDIFSSDVVMYPLLRIFRRPISNVRSNIIPLNGNCIPCQRKIYISTKGNISICEKIGKGADVGNVHEGLEFENVYNHYIKEYIELSETDCSKCWAGKLCDICYAGCYKNGKINIASKKEKCDSIREYFYQNLIYIQEVATRYPIVIEELKKYVLT